MERGYVKLFRKIADSEIWNEKPFSRGQAWVDLILLANHKNGYFRVRGVRVDVERGQVGTSSKSIAIRWGWSRGKVLRFLDELETVQQIVQQKDNVTTLITIVNYDMYQVGEQQTVQQTGRKRDANGTQTDTNKKDKKDKKEKKKDILSCKTGRQIPFLKIVSFLNEKCDTNYRAETAATKKHIKARFNEGFSEQDFYTVIEYKSREWRGDPEMHQYLRPVTLFGTKFESYLQAAGGSVFKPKANISPERIKKIMAM